MSAARKMRTARWRAYLSEWLTDAELAQRLSATCKRPACWVDASRVSFDVEVVAA